MNPNLITNSNIENEDSYFSVICHYVSGNQFDIIDSFALKPNKNKQTVFNNINSFKNK